MFENLNFWENWYSLQKRTLAFLSITAIISTLLLIIAYYSGGSFIIQWEELNTTSPVRTLFDKFYSGLYAFSIYADRLVITQSLIPGDININTTYSYIFLLLFSTIVLFLYSLATSLSRFYFVLSSVFFAIMLLMFRFENLILFGLYGKEVYACVLLVFFGIAYYFHAFNDGISLTFRFSVFALVALIIAVTFQLFSQVNQPFLYLASYVIIAPLILSVIFILMLGFEIVRGFLFITSQSGEGEGKGNFLHFAIITIIYLGVLTLIFLHKHHYIGWKIVFLDAVWILIVASVIGFWGFRKKEEIYSYIFDFKPTGAYLYISMALICICSYSYFLITANDPYVDILNDTIIISQLSFGLLFFVYVISNFLPAMMEGHPVHKVLYNPKFMPYFSARLASIIGVVALFFIIRMAPYYQAYAGYYISLAGLFKAQNNSLLASEYYNQANIYGKQTHMGNYALAEISESENKFNDRNRYLAIAINTNPTDFAFAKLANGYNEANKPFDEIFTLRNGVMQFPDSGPLQNNLGIAFSKINIIDTALIHLRKALKKSSSKKASSINIPVALVKKQNLTINWDSLSTYAGNQKNLAEINNLSVLYAKNNRTIELPDSLSFNASVSNEQLVYNYSLLFEKPYLADSSRWRAFQEYYYHSGNTRFRENLEYAFANAYLKTGKSIAALRIMRGLENEDKYGYSKYDILMAQSLMKFQSPEMAVPYFQKTIQYYGPEMKLQYAIALIEEGSFPEAARILSEFEGKEKIPLLNDLQRIIDLKDLETIANESDRNKYNFLRYKGDMLSEYQFEGVIISMVDEGYKFASMVEFIKYLFRHGNYSMIEKTIENLNINEIKTPHIQVDLLRILIKYYWRTHQLDQLQEIYHNFANYKMDLGAYYLMAEIASMDHNDHELIQKKYEELGSFDAFCEEGILAASSYFNEQGETIKSYNILLESIEWNQYSLLLNKAYLKAAINMGLINYTDDILDRLKNILPSESFEEINLYVTKLLEEKDTTW